MPDENKKRDKLEALLDAAVDAIITTDASGTIEAVNPSAETLFGYEREEFLNKKVDFLMPEPWASAHDHYMRNYCQTGQKRIIGIGREVEGLKSDGTTFPMHLSISEFYIGENVFFTAIIHDLRQRKQTEEALLQAQKMESVGQLTGGIAHDFNNLLTIITGNLELLEMRLEDDFQRDLVNEALEAAELGSNLTSRLLTFARRSVLEPKLVCLNDLVANLENMLSRTLGENIELKTSLDTNLWRTKVDPAQVENAILNLAVNARDAMPSGGRLAIETRNTEIDDSYTRSNSDLILGSYACISVSDTGYGMTKDVIERAFDPFFSTKEAGRGTGLGLSMVFGFAKQSGGHVTLYSEPGLGTTINIYLPKHEADDVVDDSLPHTSSVELKIGNGERILVVEDDFRVKAVTIERLRALNYQTVSAGSGDEALEILKTIKNIDLVFTDLVMPGKTSGYDLVKEIQATYPTIKLLMTSGYAEDLIKQETLQEHRVDLLRKPYRHVDLAHTIHRVLHSRSPDLRRR